MPGELVKFSERSRVEQPVDPLARGHLALGVLPFHRALRSGVHGLPAAPVQISDLAGGGVQVWLPGGIDRHGSIGGHAGQVRPGAAAVVARGPL